MAVDWTLAPSLTTLRREINDLWPGRNKASDGTIGNAEHSNRTSDHNPDAAGVVRAMDITSWVGPDGDVADLLVRHLRATRDPRVAYIIWQRRICNSRSVDGAAPWAWRPYAGSNPHDKHVHISVRPAPTGDDPSPWHLEDIIMPTAQEIAAAVLASSVRCAWDGKTRSVEDVLSSVDYYARSGALTGTLPETATSSPGRPTALALTLARIAAAPAPTVPAPVDVSALAVALAAKLPTLPADAVKQAIREVLGSLDGVVPPSSAGH
jgi:hypothetical protein